MKIALVLGTAVLILGLASVSLVGQTQTNAGASSGYIETSKIVGTKVKTAQGEEVGTVKDVVIDRNTGCMAYTVLSAGGTSTEVAGGPKLVAVPWTVYTTASEPDVLVVNVDGDRIYNAPAFDYARINEYSTGGYIDNVYSYYGVSRQAGAGERTSVTGTAATGGRQGERANAASSEEAGRSRATASASPTATRSARETRGRAREESPAASPRETETPTSRRHHTEKMTSPTGEEESSETKTSPSKEQPRHRATEERPEPGATVTPEDR